ncbi:MAG: hypothetical protein R2702_03290 [Acidimicrobiales bacterium]
MNVTVDELMQAPVMTITKTRRWATPARSWPTTTVGPARGGA